MAKKQRKYDMEYKIQAVKLAKELGGAKAASELGIPENTMYAWTKAAREGRLDAGPGSHTPQTAMSLAEEMTLLRRQVKEQEKEIRRLKEENEILEQALFFRQPSQVCKRQRMMFPAIKTEDGVIKWAPLFLHGIGLLGN